MQPTIYERIGGGTVLRKLAKVFYRNMDTLEEAQGIRKLHAKSLKISEKKLFMFLSGFFGGPNLYMEKYGHPKLRQRHLPFVIGKDEAEQWLDCMNRALEEVVLRKDLKQEMLQYFSQAAYHMVNQNNSSPNFENILK